jgi:hypothetical protein
MRSVFRKRSASALWLIVIAAGAAILIVVSVVLNLLADDRADELLPADTPEGTVQRYLLALSEDEVPAAYDYVGDELKETCTLQHFIQTSSYQRERDFSARLSGTTKIDDGYLVVVEIGEPGFDPPFGQGQYSYTVTFSLAQEDGGWRISEPPWPVNWCPSEREAPAPATAEAVGKLRWPHAGRTTASSSGAGGAS